VALPLSCSYSVRSQISVDVFRQFLDAIEGNNISITDNNSADRYHFALEFGFRHLSDQITSSFGIPESAPNSIVLFRKISALETRMVDQDALIHKLNAKIAEQGLVLEEAHISADCHFATKTTFPEVNSRLLKRMVSARVIFIVPAMARTIH
jgi:hypothetical protein